MINFVFPSLAFIESSSRWGLDSDSGDCQWPFGEGYRVVNEDQQSSSLTMGTILTHCGVVPDAGVLGFG